MIDFRRTISLMVVMIFLLGGVGPGLAIDRLIDETEPGPTEQRFQQALTSYQEGNVRQARDAFRTIVNETPGHARARDARYFLRRIEAQLGETGEVPLIRVKLLETGAIDMTQPVPLEVELPDGSTRSVAGGEPWEVQAEGSRLNAGSFLPAGPSQIRIRPVDGYFIKLDDQRYRGTLRLQAEDNKVLLINKLPLNEYLYGVVRKEIAPNWPMEAIRSQAVVSRSFALHRMMHRGEEPYDLDATWLSQMYGGVEAEDDVVIRAVEETAGEVLVYEEEPIAAFFHANSGGHTERAESVWPGTSPPYLTDLKDPYSVGANHDRWESQLSMRELTDALRSADLPPPDYPPDIRVSDRAESGRALTVAYRAHSGGTVTVRGNRFRMALGPEIIRSTWFDEIKTRGTTIRFAGRGWGHGVGMSQWGAYTMANEGYSYEEILAHYYPSARLQRNFNGVRIHHAGQ